MSKVLFKTCIPKSTISNYIKTFGITNEADLSDSINDLMKGRLERERELRESAKKLYKEPFNDEPKPVIEISKLDYEAVKKVFLALFERQLEYDEEFAYPVSKLSIDLGLDEKTVIRCINELVRKNFVIRRRIPCKEALYGYYNVYQVTMEHRLTIV